MIISYHGAECFKISQGNLALVFNPQSKLSADITLFSTGKNPAYAEASAGKAGFIIDGPGEYEIKSVFIKGFLSTGPTPSNGPGKKINTIYLISFEGINLCFLDALKDSNLPTETLEAIEDIDILFVPVGGGDTLDPVAAYKLAVSLEPSVIIPMHYTESSLKQFLKEGGETKMESLDKFVVKKKDLEGKEGEIVVLREE